MNEVDGDLVGRLLSREEIAEVWTIDRTELIEEVYHHVNGELKLEREHYDLTGWPPGEAEAYQPILETCHDRGGWFYGLFDQAQLVAVAVLDSLFIGRARDQLQLKFLHVSHPYRGRGLGRKLFALAREEAEARGARKMYISATASKHTIDFYLQLGCTLAPEPDPELFALEPEDIHLELEFTRHVSHRAQ